MKTSSSSFPCANITVSRKKSTNAYIYYWNHCISTVSHGHAVLCCWKSISRAPWRWHFGGWNMSEWHSVCTLVLIRSVCISRFFMWICLLLERKCLTEFRHNSTLSRAACHKVDAWNLVYGRCLQLLLFTALKNSLGPHVTCYHMGFWCSLSSGEGFKDGRWPRVPV